MTHAYANAPLEKSLEAFVRERFGAVEILSVTVDEDFDRDGDRVLEITVSFKGSAKEIAQNEPPGFLRGLQDQLWGLKETAFPIVRFRPSAA